MGTIDNKACITEGRAILGIELGSTRIKAVLLGENNEPIASGGYGWENSLVDNIWTYSLDEVWQGLRGCYQDLVQQVQQTYGVTVQRLAAIGLSGMMHGYMAFDRQKKLLVPFRTWRNTITAEACEKLTSLFQYNIPQRWSIAHIYQAILNNEPHVTEIDFFTTLSGYIHWQLTGEKLIGVGDASGMFPIDTEEKSFNRRMIDQFNNLISEKNVPWKLENIMPTVLTAGASAGTLTAEGAKLLDVTGQLQPGIPLCPPEGDAGTGMAATNSVAQRTGNVSAGTSVFAMVVLEKELSKVYPELDLVTTPAGDLVAMAHCNNCTSDLNAWVNLFKEFSELFGMELDMNHLYGTLYTQALQGDADCGGLLAYNYLSGEHMTGFDEGRPLFVRLPNSKLNIRNFIRVHLFTSLGALKTGMDILVKQEHVKLDKLLGHGGFFKTREVGQRIMAAATNTTVSVMETAGEGGAWGIALLASYMKNKKEGQKLEQFLANHVFAGQKEACIAPDTKDVAGFEAFMKHYTKGLAIERAAVDFFKG